MGRTKIVLAILLFAASCCRLPLGFQPTTPQEGWACPPLPATFTEADLIGTWEAKYGADLDTIVLRDDGTYKQTYVSYTDGYRYEGGWKRWWIERRPSGGLYLHLEGMQMCSDTDELCYLEGGGGGDYPWWDPCEDRRVVMSGEVVLMVIGVPEDVPGYAPKGIWLAYLHAGPDHGSDHFTLREP